MTALGLGRLYDLRVDRDRLMVGLLTLGALLLLAILVLLPIGTLLIRSVQDGDGRFVGGANLIQYLQTPALLDATLRSLRVAGLSAAICTTIAYVYAYALTLSCMRWRTLFQALALIPLMAPSLLMAISLIYLFGNQGVFKPWMGEASIYGEPGMVIGAVLWTLPHALLILMTTLATMDGRLVEAAQTLGAGRWRVFATVILPASRYGLLMTFVVVFVLVLTDFGVPKVIGGQDAVLATDIYKQVVGQQNFQMGAVVALVLLLPAVIAFLVERQVRARQTAAMTIRATPHRPAPYPPRDRALFAFCSVVALVLLGVIGMAVFASLASFWPYNLAPSLRNYAFDHMDGGGWASYGNSLTLALWTAATGAVLAFVTAYLVDKPRDHGAWRETLNLIATLPLAIPGLALGLGYILFFNAPWNPLQGLYGTMTILVLCTVAHFYAVAHLTQLSALRQLDREYELVSDSLGISSLLTAWRVHLPVCLPTVLQVAGYFFVNAMTTVSAVVFLYAPHTQLASVAVLNMDDAGDIAPAAAMAVLIFVTAAAGRGLFALASHAALRGTQRWRQP